MPRLPPSSGTGEPIALPGCTWTTTPLGFPGSLQLRSAQSGSRRSWPCGSPLRPAGCGSCGRTTTSPAPRRTRPLAGRRRAGLRRRLTARRSSFSRIRSVRARRPASASWRKCSRASDTRPRTYVVFLKPSSVADGWERTALWQQAARHRRTSPLFETMTGWRHSGSAPRRPVRHSSTTAAGCCSSAAELPARAGMPATTPDGPRSSRY